MSKRAGNKGNWPRATSGREVSGLIRTKARWRRWPADVGQVWTQEYRLGFEGAARVEPPLHVLEPAGRGSDPATSVGPSQALRAFCTQIPTPDDESALAFTCSSPWLGLPEAPRCSRRVENTRSTISAAVGERKLFRCAWRTGVVMKTRKLDTIAKLGNEGGALDLACVHREL